MNSTLSPWPYTSLRDPRTIARVGGYSISHEYRLDWDTRLATLDREVLTESHSLSLPHLNARRIGGDALVIVGALPGDCPDPHAVFTIVQPDQRRALASGVLRAGESR